MVDLYPSWSCDTMSHGNAQLNYVCVCAYVRACMHAWHSRHCECNLLMTGAPAVGPNGC